MARYRRIETGTWTDQKYVELSAPQPNGRTLWHYLLTGQRTTIFPGLVLAKEIVMAADLGWPIDGHAATLRTAWAEIEARAMAVPDWVTGVIVLPRSLLDRRGEPREASKPTSPNVFKGWAKSWDDVPDCDLKAWYLAELGRFAVALDKAAKAEKVAYEAAFAKSFASHLERVRESYPNAFASRTPTRSRVVQGDMFSVVNESRTRSRVVPQLVSNPRAFPVPVPVSEESEPSPSGQGLFSLPHPPPLAASDLGGADVERNSRPPPPADPVAHPAYGRLKATLGAMHREVYERVRLALDAPVRGAGVSGFDADAGEFLKSIYRESGESAWADVEADARHVLAVREREAMQVHRSCKYLGVSLWDPRTFRIACSMAVGEPRGSQASSARKGPAELAMDELRRLERLEAEGEQSR